MRWYADGEQGSINELKNELVSHFIYYGKEVEAGYYAGFERDNDTIDSMITDLEASIRVLERLKAMNDRVEELKREFSPEVVEHYVMNLGGLKG